jgi:hypothetical protein
MLATLLAMRAQGHRWSSLPLSKTAPH